MRAFVAAQPWLEVAYLPPYAPELNPVGATRSRFR
jgi:transposase